MTARHARSTGRLLGCLLVLLAVLHEAAHAADREPPAAKAPKAFLIYLLDGSDPIVVKRYVEENDQVRFEKYGGWIGIPRYEILKIVPDDPDAVANLPSPPQAP